VLPGKKYTPGEILRIVVHWKWLIVFPVVLGATGAAVVSRLLPDRYRSESLVIAAAQRISDSYVKPSVTSGLEERLPTLRQRILNRTHLERIINDFNLYADVRAKKSMEDIVQRMRDSDIEFKVEGGDSSDRPTDRLLRISYVSSTAKTAQQVTARLVSLVIDESLRDRENVATDTNEFLETQLGDARARLIAHEKKLEAYRQRHSGELPTQATANLQVIQNTQLQLQALSEATDRARERRLLVERQLADLESSDPVVAATPAPPTTPSPDGGPRESTAQQLEAAQARLHTLQMRDKPNHPDVRMLQRTIRDLEAKLESEARQPSQPPPSDEPLKPAEAQRQKKIRDLTAQRDDIDRELQEKEKQDRRLHATVSEYQARLDAQPTRESDLTELMRDYNTLQTTYQDLLAKRETSKIAANLERRNIGEQFQVLEPPLVPERPFSPKRPVIYLAGTAGGMGLGLLLVAFFEYRESGLEYEEDVTRLFDLPVLALVPVMISAAERQARRQRQRIFLGVAAVTAILAAAAAVALLKM
jgi:polysaccharide chain length determinant protein (PEP-CTERM system associated)